jgi:hypothetical protein
MAIKLGLLVLLSLAFVTIGAQSNKPDEVPNVDFCDMVRRPEQFFDKTIRITASWEQGYEGANLNNVRCVRNHDDSIGVGFVPYAQGQPQSIRQSVDKIMSGKSGPQPRVTVVGILRNASRRDFAWYRYRFDILRVEDIADDITQRIVTYAGTLRGGVTYRASVQADKTFRLSFESPLHQAPHQAVRLEWTNLSQFRGLVKLRRGERRQIVFRVAADDIQRIDEQRWNRILRLEILLVE